MTLLYCGVFTTGLFVAGMICYARHSNMVYYWKCRLFHPFNVVKVKTLDPMPFWVDRDELLLHACFQILVDFVEGEQRPSDKLGWRKNEHVENEIEYLYDWWTQRRPARIDPLNQLPVRYVDCEDIFRPLDPNDPEYVKWENAFGESRRLRDEWHREDQNMLKRLIDVRPHLWT